MKPKILDLFSGAGGAGFGYHLAGFDVHGVDIAKQPRYPFSFDQADALEYLARLIETGDIEQYRAIHSSPPCQAHTSLKSMWNAKEHVDLIPQTRELLIKSGLPWVMENVEGSPLQYPVILCGTMFDLGAAGAQLRRHRAFELGGFFVLRPFCRHSAGARVIGVYGGGGTDSRREHNTQDYPVTARRAAMEIDWMSGKELNQAIPPAYTKFLGEALLKAIRERSAA